MCPFDTRWSSCNCKNKKPTSSFSYSGAADDADLTEVDSATGFMSRTLMVLKGKTNPETRLSTEDLQVMLANSSLILMLIFLEQRSLFCTFPHSNTLFYIFEWCGLQLPPVLLRSSAVPSNTTTYGCRSLASLISSSHDWWSNYAKLQVLVNT